MCQVIASKTLTEFYCPLSSLALHALACCRSSAIPGASGRLSRRIPEPRLVDVSEDLLLLISMRESHFAICSACVGSGD
jgi:hypothetical protein